MPARVAQIVVAALCLSACTLDFDAVGPIGGAEAQGAAPAGGASAGAPAGGGTSCNGSCVDLGSFTGPFSLDDAGCQAPVVGGYADSDPIFSAAAASCTCACEPPTLLGCPSVALKLHDEAGCDGAGATIEVAEGVCVAPEVEGFSAYSFDRPATGGPASSTCVSDGAPAEKPTVELTAPFTACALDESSCAGSEICLPEDSTGLCVLGADEPCPEAFPLRRMVVLESELVDGRDCQCACGPLTATCTPAFVLYDDGGCSAVSAAQLAPDCIGPLDSTQIEGLVYQPLASGAGCETQESPSGEVVAGPSHALCCST